MALQGDLNSFALPDVLRLLAGTGKSGRLEVTGPVGSGEVMLRDGAISSAATTTSPNASDPSDVIFDLLRFDGGAFDFAEGDVDDPGLGADVEATIGAAQALVEEWAEIETVVPSMGAWVVMASEIDGDEVIVTADQWRALAAIGSGGNVHDLATALQLTDLAASRQVMEMVQAELVVVRATHGYAPPAVELDDFEQFEVQGTDALDPMDDLDPMSDLEDLVAEDRPVVMEERDDALLPEPLPGEGIAYEGEPLTGVVDGRSFDTLEDLEHTDHSAHDADHGVEDGHGDQNDEFEAFDSLASFEEAAAMSDRAGEPGTIEGFGDADPFSLTDAEAEAAYGSETYDAEPAPVVEMPGASADAGPVDDERDSLLKFLSSVKP